MSAKIAVIGVCLIYGKFSFSQPIYDLGKRAQEILNMFPQCDHADADMIKAWTGAYVDPYLLPTSDDMVNYKSLFQALDGNDIEGVRNSLLPLQMVGCRMTEPNVIFFHAPIERQLITFIWRLGGMKVPGNSKTYNKKVVPLVIESPHTLTDKVTLPLISILHNTYFRVIFMNGVHPHLANNTSNGAHNRTTAFFKVHALLADLYPEALFVQIHGMKGADNFQLLVQDGSGADFYTRYKSGARLLAFSVHKLMPRRLGMIPDYPEYPGITQAYHSTYSFTSVLPLLQNSSLAMYRISPGSPTIATQAPHLNNVLPGRFIHVECNSYFRGGISPSDHFAKALSLAMDHWVIEDDLLSNTIQPEWSKAEGD